MNTMQLECFLAVAEHLNFSKAAQSVALTQPAVSHQIRALEEELGDVLFSAVNVSRHLGVDGEEALTRATEKFIRRFSAMERTAAGRGTALDALSMDELDHLWQEAKEEEKISGGRTT